MPSCSCFKCPSYQECTNGARHVLQEKYLGYFLAYSRSAPPNIHMFSMAAHSFLALLYTFVSFASCSDGGSVVTFKKSNKIRISDNEVR